VEFRPVERAPDSFQRSITQEQALAMCRQAFGAPVQPTSVIELGYAAYNNAYRVDLGSDRPVILRVAPEPSRQSRAERSLMRNEHASVPYLAPIAALMPRTLAADFTHQIIGRDYLFQTLLDGVPAPDGLAAYPRPEWAPFFRQLGTITRRIHEVRGDSFGWVAGPRFARWREAYTSSLADLAAALEDAGLDAGDIREAAAAATLHSEIFDEITEPRLLHGDLWIANVMVSPSAAEPTITGVCDCDRTSWGDPAADWSIYRAGERPGTERDAFWDTYGTFPATLSAAQRARFYQILHVGTLRLEEHRRLGKSEGVQASYKEIRALLAQLQPSGRSRPRPCS
jgi:aminoglycoside phosphotransferase (APT) family kinase protein